MSLFPETIFDLVYEDRTTGADEPENRSACPADEALIESVNRFGRADPAFISSLTGKTPRELLFGDLKGAVFQDPAVFQNGEPWAADKGWLLPVQYLSGNVLRKLRLANEMNERFPGLFQDHVDALRRLLPDAPSAEEIHVSLGATWLPESLYEDFVQDLLKLMQRPVIRYSRTRAKWTVRTNNAAKGSVLSNFVYGTPDLSAVKIIEQTMNARNVKVYDYIHHHNGSVDAFVNKEKTFAAQEKQKKILAKFDEWIHAEPSRAEKIEEHYANEYVGCIGSCYDGSFLRFPDLNPDVTLYPHQRSAIARILLSGENVMLAHPVGTGKTYEMICAAHELKRMGLSTKTMLVVPNNVLRSTADMHRHLYPKDDILVVYPKDFTPEKRGKVLREIRDGDYVCVYMAYSSFDMIVMSKDYWIGKKQEEIRKLRRAAANCTDSFEKRTLTAEADKLQRRLSKYVLETEECPWMTFEQLGIHTLFLDEAHNYKNIALSTRTDNIVGMHSKGSKKCVEMLEKCHCVERLVFATGTPLTNSLADQFVMQTYLQPEELRLRAIDSFDMWINTFGERETNYEISIDAKELRPVTRFSSFHNLTELMGLFSGVCDFTEAAEDQSELPAFRGYTDVRVPRSAAQTAYMQFLAKRNELIRARLVPRTQDNRLRITAHGRACALDIRLVDTAEAGIRVTEQDLRQGKIPACADQIMRFYNGYPGTCQIVFSDIGTPKDRFNVYDELRRELIRRGIPADEIAFVHDAVSEKARAAMFRDMNRGRLRVVIGSTAKLGVGVNVQERLVALHHLSVPWRPADMVQREGRILRRGNTCEEVFIIRYITEGTFDSYSWQLLENKQRFISSFLSGTAAARDREDIADAVLSYAELKALAIGNPLIKKRVETSNRLDRKRLAFRQRQKQLAELRSVAERHPEAQKKHRRLRGMIAEDIRRYRAAKAAIPMDERLAFGEELLAALRENGQARTERRFDTYQSFAVMLPADMLPERPYVYVCGESGSRYFLDMDTEKPLGCAKRIDHLLEHLPERAAGAERAAQEEDTQYQAALADLARGNPYEKEIVQLTMALAEIDQALENTKEETV